MVDQMEEYETSLFPPPSPPKQQAQQHFLSNNEMVDEMVDCEIRW